MPITSSVDPVAGITLQSLDDPLALEPEGLVPARPHQEDLPARSGGQRFEMLGEDQRRGCPHVGRVVGPVDEHRTGAPGEGGLP